MANNAETRVTFKVFNQDFNRAMTEMDASAKRLRQELKLEQEQLKETGTQSERLAANLRGLEQQQQLATQRVQETAAQLARAEEYFGENSVEANRLADALLTAQIAEQRLANQITNTSQRLDQQGASTRALENLIEATGRSVDDFANVLGQDLVNAIRNGTATSSQLERAIGLIGRESLGAGGNIVELRNSLRQVDDGGSIDDVRRDLQNLSQQIEDTSGEIGGLTDKTTAIGGALTAGITAPLAGVGLAAGVAAKQFDDASAQIQMSLGVTAEEAEKLELTATNLWKDGFGESLTEVTDALVKVKQNMKNVEDGAELEKVTRDAMLLAQTFESDVNEVTRAGNNLMVNFGVSSEKAFDLMSWGAQNGLNFSQEMFDNLAEYSPLFASMGYSAEEYFAILKRGSDAGVYNLDYLNDAMKEFQIRMKEDSLGVYEAMWELSDSANDLWGEFIHGEKTISDLTPVIIDELKNMDSQVMANNIGVALFGTKWEDLEATAMYAMLGTNEALVETTGTMDRLAEVQEQTFGQRWNAILRTSQTALLPLGETLLDLAEDWLPKISSGVESVTGWFNGLSPAAQTTTVAIGAVAAAAGPLVAGFGFVASGIGSVTGLIAPLAAGLTGAGAAAGAAGASAGIFGSALAVATGPIGLTVAGLATLGVGIYGTTKAMNESSMEVQDWSEGVSESTQKALGSYLELSDSVSQQLSEMYLTSSTITDKTVMHMTAKYSEMNTQIVEGMKVRHQEELTELQTFFLNSSAITSAEEEKIIADRQARNEREIEEQNTMNERVKVILETAAAEKRELTERENEIINNYNEMMKENAVRIMSESETEQKVIMERMKQNASEISAQQAAEVVKNAVKQKDEVIKEANETYDKSIAQIIKMRDETGEITAEQADRMIAEATKSRDKTVYFAEDMHEKIVSEAKKQASEHIEQVDWETGETLTKWQVYKNNVSSEWKSMWESADKWFSDIGKSISTNIDKGVKWASEGVGKIKGFFTGLELKMPDIKLPKMPKFSLETSTKTVFGKEITYPSGLDVKWNAQGAIFTKPTVFNSPNYGLQGFGEAGPEAALPLTDRVLGTIGSMIAQTMPQAASQIIQIQPAPVIIDGRMVAEITFDTINGMQYNSASMAALTKGVNLG